MDVKTPREINLAFLSLLKLFSEVQVEQKSIALNPKPRLPSSISPGSAQQVMIASQASDIHPACFRIAMLDLALSVLTYQTWFTPQSPIRMVRACVILQFLVNNRQLYKLERSSAISRCILPGSVDLDVNTYLTISPQVSFSPISWREKFSCLSSKATQDLSRPCCKCDSYI